MRWIWNSLFRQSLRQHVMTASLFIIFNSQHSHPKTWWIFYPPKNGGDGCREEGHSVPIPVTSSKCVLILLHFVYFFMFGSVKKNRLHWNTQVCTFNHLKYKPFSSWFNSISTAPSSNSGNWLPGKDLSRKQKGVWGAESTLSSTLSCLFSPFYISNDTRWCNRHKNVKSYHVCSTCARGVSAASKKK